MLLTDILFGDILLAKSDTTDGKLKEITYATICALLTGGKNMFIYDKLNYLQEQDEELGINALSYVVLDCGR